MEVRDSNAAIGFEFYHILSDRGSVNSSYTRSMGIYALPAYLIQYKEKALLLQGFAYADFTAAIRTLLAYQPGDARTGTGR